MKRFLIILLAFGLMAGYASAEITKLYYYTDFESNPSWGQGSPYNWELAMRPSAYPQYMESGWSGFAHYSLTGHDPWDTYDANYDTGRLYSPEIDLSSESDPIYVTYSMYYGIAKDGDLLKIWVCNDGTCTLRFSAECSTFGKQTRFYFQIPSEDYDTDTQIAFQLITNSSGNAFGVILDDFIISDDPQADMDDIDNLGNPSVPWFDGGTWTKTLSYECLPITTDDGPQSGNCPTVDEIKWDILCYNCCDEFNMWHRMDQWKCVD